MDEPQHCISEAEPWTRRTPFEHHLTRVQQDSAWLLPSTHLTEAAPDDHVLRLRTIFNKFDEAFSTDPCGTREEI